MNHGLHSGSLFLHSRGLSHGLFELLRIKLLTPGGDFGAVVDRAAVGSIAA